MRRIIFCIILLQILFISIFNKTFDKASALETSECLAQNKLIEVTPIGNTGDCHDIQKAIDNANDSDITIQIASGTYTINSAPINVINKQNLSLVGIGTEKPFLDFSQNQGKTAIFIQGSSGFIQNLKIVGNTQVMDANYETSLIEIRQSNGFSLNNLFVEDQGEHGYQSNSGAIFINNSTDDIISNLSLKSWGMAIYAKSSQNLKITDSFIHDSYYGIITLNTSSQVENNLISGNELSGIYFTNPTVSQIKGNTIINNKGSYTFAAVSLDLPENLDPNAQVSTIVTISHNIIVHNPTGIYSGLINGPSVFLEFNDVWNNSIDNYLIATVETGGKLINPTGSNVNISLDPIFGTEYCLGLGSPAIFGDTTNLEFMGHKGPCNPATLNLKIALQGIEKLGPDKNTNIIFIDPQTNIVKHNKSITMISDNNGIYSGKINYITPGLMIY